MDWWKKKRKLAFDKEQTLLLCRKRGAMLLEDLIKCCDGKSNPIRFFSTDFIIKATNNFSNSNQFSGFRSHRCDWYSGINDNYCIIVIKKYTDHMLGNLDSYFCRDVAISSMVSGHKNFMKLVGCCLDYKDPFMVYYGENKQHSLIDFEKIVSWKRRMKIGGDIATALAYLHTAFSTPYIYRIMSIENILIDEDGVAKLSDFSFCIPIPVGETFVKVDEVAGTYGYMDYNYMINRTVSEKTDVYGFGMFMLTLLIGRKITLDYHVLVNPEWASEFFEEDRLVDEIVDRKMLENMGEVTEEERRKMNAFRLLSVRCLGLKGEVPTMVEVAKELKKIMRSF